MKLFHSTKPRTVDPNTFTGEATLTRLDGVSQDPAINLYRVAFQPNARTAWHSHTGPQLLYVIAGCCRVQLKGESTQDVPVGGAIRIEPGELHWHGATPDAAMTHLAINVNATTDWFDKVTDTEYLGHR